MAGKDDLLNRLTALVGSFDDASWEALASKGLLRRARKDLEKGLAIAVREQTTDAIQIAVPPFVVTMTAAGPGAATCSCPTPGICQHILAAGIYLQSQATETPTEKVAATPDSIRDEIRLLSSETLKAWVGTAEYRKAVDLFGKNSLPPVIEYSDTVVIRLMPSATEVRFVPRGGLDGLILPKQHGKRAGVAALLALRRSLGFEIPAPTAQQSLVDTSGTPRTKKEILDSACSLLADAVAVGLSHASEMLVSRLVTLAVSAQGAQMPRVSLALKTIADEVDSILDREARADEARLLLLIGRVYALMDAIRSSSDRGVELAGTARGQYIEVPEIELSGVGAYTWQSGSGYIGLTLIFWAGQTNEFLTWSYARPEIQRADARARFFGEGPWDGAQSPKQVSTANLKLRHARRTANGRLSASTKTSALVLSQVKPETLDFGERQFSSWDELLSHVAAKQPMGLRESNPLDMIVVLQPSHFGARTFDAINQTFCWEIFDKFNRGLTLTLPFRDWTKDAIKMLEQLAPPPEQTWRFVVRASLQDRQLWIEPVSILRAENTESPVFHLAFDSLPQTNTNSAALPVSDPVASDEDQIEETETLAIVDAQLPPTGSLHNLLTELNQRLEAIAEAGMQSGLARHREWFIKSHEDAFKFGFTPLARLLEKLAGPSATADTVVKARYLTHLYSQAAEQVR